MRVAVGRDEERVIPLLWVGGDSEIDYDIVLEQPGASVMFWGLAIGRDEQTLKLKVRVTHAAPNTKSSVIVKSALFDRAKVHVDGLTIVNKGARKTEAWLAAHIMLLSDKATGEAIPNLEIIENDIKAGHATTVGRVDEMQMFYLMSRGLDQKSAKAMIVQGFLEDAVMHLPSEMRSRALGVLGHES